ncbi:MAG: OPT/YSL family transporter [Candidatus Thorarchaeota archaeon]
MTDSEHLGDEAGSEGFTPKPIADEDCTIPEDTKVTASVKSLTIRGITLAIILNIVYTIINAYLGINFGFGLGFGIITVLTAYTLFHVARNGSSRQEIATTMIASTGFVIYWTLTVAMYVQAYTLYTLPWWLAPPKEVLLNGSPLDFSWIAPITFHLGFVLISTALGFIAALAVVDYVQTRKKTKFPFYLASGVTINTCMETGQQSRFMFRWLGVGILVTVIQYFINAIVAPFGLSAISWDFTPYLPAGFALGFMLNISLLAISFIIDPKVSITMLVAGVITYCTISPILVTLGIVTPGATGMDMYFNLLFGYMIGPALGIMLLSGLMVYVIVKLRARWQPPKSPEELKGEEIEGGTVGFVEYMKTYLYSLVYNRRLGLAYLIITFIFIFVIVMLNVFSPFPIWISVVISVILLLPIALIDTFVMVKFVGEAGLGMGVQRLAFYEIPLAMGGLEGYTPFMAYPAINPFTTTDTLGNMKIGTMTDTPRRSILIAQLVKIFPGAIASVLFVLAAWYLIGFPTETFPAVGVLQGFAIVSIFATQAAGAGFDFIAFFVAGGIVGTLAAFFPISSLGVALAMFLPPSYFIPFSIGGFLRLYTVKKYGTKWFARRGQVIAVGFIAGAAISQVIVSFLAPVQQIWILPICIIIILGALWRYRRDPDLAPRIPRNSEE